MITYREYCKRLNERKSEDCQIQEDWGKTSPIPKEVHADVKWEDNFHWIDFGLPSGTLWADVNLYNPDDDHGLWTYEEIMNSRYRDYVPTKEQLLELASTCKFKWDNRRGLEVRGKDEKRIFLPAEGCRVSESNKVVFSGDRGCYWFSSGASRGGYILYFSDTSILTGGGTSDEYGRSVRLVKKK